MMELDSFEPPDAPYDEEDIGSPVFKVTYLIGKNSTSFPQLVKFCSSG